MYDARNTSSTRLDFDPESERPPEPASDSYSAPRSGLPVCEGGTEGGLPQHGEAWKALRSAYQRVAMLDDRKAKLPVVRDELARRSFELQQLEAEADAAERQLQALQSITLTSLLESLGGQRRRKVEEGRAAIVELERALQNAQSAVDGLAAQVETIERDIVELDGAEDAFREACQSAVAEILAAGGAQAEQLIEIETALTGLREAERAATKAQETGRQLLRHLESLDRAVRNARGNRRMSTALGGAVGGLIKNAVASMGPSSAARYVVESLQRFCRELGELPLGDHPDDADLIRVRAELDGFRERLSAEYSGILGWDQVSTLSPETDVRAAASCVKTLLSDVQRDIAEQEARRLTILLPEGAEGEPAAT